MKLAGSTVLVTGASRGIGAAAAVALAERGARLHLAGRDLAALQAVAAQVAAAGGEAHCHAVDLADAQAVESALASLAASAAAPDALVHSAGAGRWLFTEETSPTEAAQMMGAPYFAAFHVTRLFLPAMLALGRGHILVVNSPVARGAWPGAAGYTAARYALQGFTNALCVDLAGTGVGITSLVAGRVSSGYFERNAIPESHVPALGRLLPTLSPQQVARAIVRGIEREKREIVMPAMLRVFFAANILAPRLVEWLMVRTGRQRPRRPG